MRGGGPGRQRFGRVAEEAHVTAPRQVLPGRTVFITSRAVGRTFRFVPRERIVESLLFCFAVAVANKEFKVRVHEVVYMSNHLHIVATFDDTSMPDFMQYLNSLCSKQLNAMRGRSGTNFETHFNAVEVADPKKILEHCAYTLANPCAAHLVTEATAWKGVTSARLEYGKPIAIERPKTGMWKPKRVEEKARQAAKKARNSRSGGKSAGRAARVGRIKTPERVEFTLERPPGFDEMSDAELRDEVRRLVVIEEAKAERERVEQGRRVLGMRRVRAQHWNAMPEMTESMFGPVPKASGDNKWARMEVLQRCAKFRSAYEAARDAYKSGERDVEFPCGTWLMRLRFNVRCASSPP